MRAEAGAGCRLVGRPATAIVLLIAWFSPASAPPGGRIDDLYKQLHQAFCGPGHAILSPEQARNWLLEEWGALAPADSTASLVEPLHPQGRFVRIHLRPFRDRGGSPDSLLAAFLRSSRIEPDTIGFRQAWRQAGEGIRAGTIPGIETADHDSLDAVLSPLGYPAIRHSASFRRAHDPAYRVVASLECAGLQKGLRSATIDSARIPSPAGAGPDRR